MQASTRGIDYRRDDAQYEFVRPHTWDGKFEIELGFGDRKLVLDDKMFVEFAGQAFRQLRSEVGRNEMVKSYLLAGLHAPVVSVANPLGWLFWADRRADLHAEMGIRKAAFQVIKQFCSQGNFPVFEQFKLKKSEKLGSYMERPGEIYEKWIMKGIY